MTVNIRRPTTIMELSNVIKLLYPEAKTVIESFGLIVDINDKIKYWVGLRKLDKVEVWPQAAIWNRTFEMKAKAQEIAMRISDYFEKGNLYPHPQNDIPAVCPHCRNPNTQRIRLCEWCGSQIY